MGEVYRSGDDSMKGTVKIMFNGSEVREWEPPPERWMEILKESSAQAPKKETRPKYEALRRLASKGTMSVDAAAKHLGLSKPAVYPMLQRAVAAGYLRRVKYGVYEAA